MVKVLGLVAAVIGLVAGCTRPPAELAPDRPSPSAPPPVSTGAPVVLYGGGAPTGWSQAGPGRFELADGALRSSGGLGLLWYTAAAFGDFVLDLDWRLSQATDNSGVFVRFPDPGGDPGVAISHGYEIQINDNPGGDPQKTGAIYGVQPAAASASRPVGEWNHYRIQVVGADYAVWLNGVLVNRFTSTDPARPGRGHVGLQNHDPTSAVSFRDIRLSPVTG